MRVHHIPVRRNIQVELPEAFVASLPAVFALATTAQFRDQIPAIEAMLTAAGKQVTLYKHRHTFHAGQILGCSTEQVEEPAVLYIGEGLFHPQALAYANEIPVYTWDPVTKQPGQIDRTAIDRRRKRREAGIKTFYMVRRIGVLLSTKSGQKDENAVKRLREEFPDKQFYVFLGNTLGIEGLEDFPFVEVWLNTACPRIGYDDIEKTEKPLINAEDVLSKHRF